MRLRFTLLFIYIAISCGCTNTNLDGKYIPSYESSEREKLSNKIISKVANKLKNDYGLIPCGSGGRISQGIEMLSLSFYYRLPTEIAQWRELLVRSIQQFVAEVNNDKHIRPYLVDPPFEPKNIQIRIFLQKPDGSCNDEGLNVVAVLNGVLEYDSRGPSGRLETFYRETYEEALLKLETLKSARENDLKYEIAI